MLGALLSLQALALAAAVPTFVVDLDESPEERWREVIAHYRDSGVLQGLVAASSAGQSLLARADKQAWLDAVRPHMDEEFLAEARGWLKYGGVQGKTVDDVILNAVGYEMNYPSYSCSGIVATMPNGTVVHGRNMDYMLEFQVNGTSLGWPDVTTEVTFVRGGAPLMTSVTWPLQLGIHTAMRFDGWSFEQNTRRTGDDMRLNLAAAQQGGLPFGLFARRLMEREPDFEAAVAALDGAKMIATQYFVVAGPRPYQGAVLTIDRGGQREPDTPALRRFAQGQGAWHLLQTNDDHMKQPHDYRRPTEMWKLSQGRQTEVSPEWIFRQMRGQPLRTIFTVFTWVAVPATGAHWTVLPNETMPGVDIEKQDRAFRSMGKTFLASPRLKQWEGYARRVAGLRGS